MRLDEQTDIEWCRECGSIGSIVQTTIEQTGYEERATYWRVQWLHCGHTVETGITEREALK
jgi:hypothetical protein